MTYFKYHIIFLLSIAFISFNAPFAKAQQEASPKTSVQLKDALHAVSKAFKINFMYETELINGKTVNLDIQSPKTQKLETVLAGLLKPVGISYYHIDSNNYALFKQPLNVIPTKSAAVITQHEADTLKSVGIAGFIYEEVSHPLPFTTVSLIGMDSVVIKSMLSDLSGQYQFKDIQPGKFLIRATQMGFITAYSKPFLFLNKSPVNLQPIILTIASKQLAEVKVTGTKPLFERRIDRLVFNVENSTLTAGSNMVDLLRNTPLIKVANSGISMVGKSGLSVMIDNRPVRLSGEDLLNYLGSLTADDVSKIEVITTPPAKYEAQGNSGIINIVLKKKNNLGFSGSASTSFTQTTYPGYSNSASLNYGANKFAISLKIRQYDRQQKATENVNLIGDTSILSDTRRKDILKGLGGTLNFNYLLSKKANIGFVYDFSETDNTLQIENLTKYVTHGQLDSTLNTPETQFNGNTAHTLTGYYDIKLDDKGKQLNVEFDFFTNHPTRENDFSSYSISVVSPLTVRNNSDLHYKVISGQINMDLPTKFAMSSFGVKFISYNNNSETNYYNYINSIYQKDFSRSNVFDYQEQNAAAYLTLNKKISKTVSVQGGLRYEFSTIDGYSLSNGGDNKYDYGNLFPTLYIEYRPNTKNYFNINYSKRINRPGFSALNPFRWYSNPFIYFSGNPFLKPSFNHNLELNYTYNSAFNITAYFQRTINGFGGITQLKDNVKISTFENYFNTSNAGISATYNWSPAKWWENYLSTVGYYSASQSASANVTPTNGLSACYSINNNFKLNVKGTTFVTLNFFQNFPSKELNVSSQSISDLTIGFKKLLMDKKLVFNASMQDLFKGSVSRAVLQYATFVQQGTTYYDTRRLVVAATYSFGKSSVKGTNKQIKFSEKSRAN